MSAGKRQRIYFVDDEPAVCKAVARTLSQLHVEVSCFHSGQECLSHLDATPCDLLITDVKMPDMSGLDVLSRAKTIAPWMPVLLVTGYGDIPTAVKAVKMGAVDFIEKPLERERFLSLVGELLENARRWTRLIGKPLTRTEVKVLCYVLEGRNSKEIAHAVDRSIRTIELHRQHIMRKFNADSVVDLIRMVSEMGLALPASQRDLPSRPK